MPEDDAGFGLAVTPDGHDLTLTPGRAYVDGILCELDATADPARVREDDLGDA